MKANSAPVEAINEAEVLPSQVAVNALARCIFEL